MDNYECNTWVKWLDLAEFYAYAIWQGSALIGLATMHFAWIKRESDYRYITILIPCSVEHLHNLQIRSDIWQIELLSVFLSGDINPPENFWKYTSAFWTSNSTPLSTNFVYTLTTKFWTTPSDYRPGPDANCQVTPSLQHDTLFLFLFCFKIVDDNFLAKLWLVCEACWAESKTSGVTNYSLLDLAGGPWGS